MTETDIKNFMNIITEQLQKELLKDEAIRKTEEEKRIAEEKKRHEEYRASLKPVSKDEFKKRFAELYKKNKEWEKFKKDKGVLYVSVGFDDIAKLVRNAKDGIDYAEILDKTESRLNFLMDDVKKSIEEIDLDFDKIAKEMEQDRRKSLGREEPLFKENIFKEIAFSKEK